MKKLVAWTVVLSFVAYVALALTGVDLGLNELVLDLIKKTPVLRNW